MSCFILRGSTLSAITAMLNSLEGVVDVRGEQRVQGPLIWVLSADGMDAARTTYGGVTGLRVILGNAKRDAVYRGISRALCDLEAEEYAVLRNMVHQAVTRVATPRTLITIGKTLAQAGGGERQIIAALDYDNSIGSRPIDHEIMDGHAREARRLFTALEINGLATTKTEVSTTIGGEPGGIILEREVALRMAACMKR